MKMDRKIDYTTAIQISQLTVKINLIFKLTNFLLGNAHLHLLCYGTLYLYIL